MRLCELLKNTKMFGAEDHPDVEISEITTNSLKAGKGSMFICLEGSKADGHRYIKEALINGAVAVVVQRGNRFERPSFCESIIFIECDNTRRAAAELYNSWYGCPSEKLKIIAVTGTNGKTSVTFILKAIFEAALYRCGIIGTVECLSGKRRVFANPDSELANLTTPDPKELYRTLALMAAEGVDYVFMEASSHALKLSKLDALKFDTAIFTNLTPDHLDFHLTMEDYRESKAKLFSMCKTAILNADDDACEYMKDRCVGQIYTYSGKGNPADFMARNAELFKITEKTSDSSAGIRYDLASKKAYMRVQSSLRGIFNIDNTLAAASCALLHGISPAIISESLASMGGVNGRMQKIKLPQGADFSVYVDYAHTPDAVDNLLKSARSMCADGRLILLFGCGGDRDRSKRAVMGRIASQKADFVVITSDNSRGEDKNAIIEDIMSGFDRKTPHKIIVDRKEAIEFVVNNASSGDVILLAGKGHEKYEIDDHGKREFDECRIVAEAAKKRFER